MRKQRLKIYGLVALLAASITCEGIDNVDIDASAQTTIEGSPLGELLGGLSFAGFDGFDITQTQQFRNQGYERDQIDSVRLSMFTLTATDPADANFDFISSISFFVEAEGLPRAEIARLDPVPEGQSVVDLNILDVDLRDYAVADTMTITTEATGVSPSEDTTIQAEVRLNVDINVDGSLGCWAGAPR